MMRRTTAALAAAVLGVGCAEGGTTPAVGFTLRAPAAELAEGTTLAIGVESGGLAVGADEVQWATRDAGVATVRAGVVTGVGPGVTWVVARRGAAADSVRLTVRFGALASGSAAVRVFETGTGASLVDGDRLQLKGFAFIHENLANRGSFGTWIRATSRDVSAAADEQSFFGGDTALSIGLSGPLQVGVSTLQPTRVNTTNGFGIGGDSTVFLQIDDGINTRPDGSIKVYVAVTSPQLEITSVTMPSAPGITPGQVTGRVSFQAAGLKLHIVDRVLEVDPIGTQTLQVYAEFASPLYHQLAPMLAARVTGNPWSDDAFYFGAMGVMDGDVLTGHFTGLLNAETETRTFFESWLRLPSPGVGEFPLSPDSAAASFRADFAEFYRTPSPAGQFGPKLHTTSHAGSITVTEFRAPTETEFGWLIGKVVATLSTTPQDPFNTEQFETLHFHLPIEPRAGLPWRR
jgi:hypothetical protein